MALLTQYRQHHVDNTFDDPWPVQQLENWCWAKSGFDPRENHLLGNLILLCLDWIEISSQFERKTFFWSGLCEGRVGVLAWKGARDFLWLSTEWKPSCYACALELSEASCACTASHSRKRGGRLRPAGHSARKRHRQGLILADRKTKQKP